MPRATVQVRVPFVDVDASHRIHFTAMFRYMEVAEHALMRSIGFPYATALTELAMPRVHLSCDFVGAVRFDDLIEIEAAVAHVGRTSWTVDFVARPAVTGDALDSVDVLDERAPDRSAEGRDRVLARGKMTVVVMDPATERAHPIPEPLRAALLGEAEARPPAETHA